MTDKIQEKNIRLFILNYCRLLFTYSTVEREQDKLYQRSRKSTQNNSKTNLVD